MSKPDTPIASPDLAQTIDAINQEIEQGQPERAGSLHLMVVAAISRFQGSPELRDYNVLRNFLSHTVVLRDRLLFLVEQSTQSIDIGMYGTNGEFIKIIDKLEERNDSFLTEERKTRFRGIPGEVVFNFLTYNLHNHGIFFTQEDLEKYPQLSGVQRQRLMTVVNQAVIILEMDERRIKQEREKAQLTATAKALPKFLEEAEDESRQVISKTTIISLGFDSTYPALSAFSWVYQNLINNNFFYSIPEFGQRMEKAKRKFFLSVWEHRIMELETTDFQQLTSGSFSNFSRNRLLSLSDLAIWRVYPLQKDANYFGLTEEDIGNIKSRVAKTINAIRRIREITS